MKCCNNTLFMIKVYCVLSCQKLCEIWYIICADVDFPLGVVGTADHSIICMNLDPYSCRWWGRTRHSSSITTAAWPSLGTRCVNQPTGYALGFIEGHVATQYINEANQWVAIYSPHLPHTILTPSTVYTLIPSSHSPHPLIHSLYTPNTLLTLCTHHLHTADSILWTIPHHLLPSPPSLSYCIFRLYI